MGKQKREEITNKIIIFNRKYVQVILQALISTQQYLEVATKPLPNISFAQETVMILKTKLTDTVKLQDFGAMMELDANEVLIIYSSLTIYSLLTGDEQEKKICVELCKYFGPLVSSAALQA